MPSKAGYPGRIWFNFTSAVKVAKLSFSSVQSKYWKESPKAFNVIASNDCSNWEILLSVTNSGFTGENQEKSWQIPCTQQKSYQCYGIEGTENLGYGTDYISLKKMKMFQLDVDNCAQNPCKHGTCQDKLNDFTCACDSGWEGKTCEQKTCKSLSDSVTPMVYDGMAGASSIYSHLYVAQNAFDQEDPDARWSSTAGYPGKIWFKFTSAVKVAKLSFSSVQSKYWKESPKAFNVIASNDCSNWDILLSVTNSGFTGENQEKSWQIPCTQQKSYQCYGIEGTENLGYGTDYISLKKMKMFQLDVDNCAQNPCKYGTCQDKLNDFTCACDSGWEGKTCDQDINDCAQNPCKHGTCQDKLNDFTCACDSGWKGKTCDQESSKEVSFDHGTAGATKSLNGYEPEGAFRQEIPSTLYQLPWISAKKLPQTVYYRFPNPLTITKFSFRSRADGAGSHEEKRIIAYSPTEFDFVGSDDCDGWETIMEVRDARWTELNEEQRWNIPEEKQKLFACFGITILDNGNKLDNGKGSYGAIQGMRMWQSTTDTPNSEFKEKFQKILGEMIRLEIQKKDTDCIFGNEERYRGRKNTTESGGICLDWAQTHPIAVERYPDNDLTSNYCRNPVWYDDESQPWCSTLNSWGYIWKEPCGIPKCQANDRHDTRIIYHLKRSLSLIHQSMPNRRNGCTSDGA